MRVCSNVTSYILIVLQNSVALVHPYLSFLLCDPECDSRKNSAKRPLKVPQIAGGVLQKNLVETQRA